MVIMLAMMTALGMQSGAVYKRPMSVVHKRPLCHTPFSPLPAFRCMDPQPGGFSKTRAGWANMEEAGLRTASLV